MLPVSARRRESPSFPSSRQGRPLGRHTSARHSSPCGSTVPTAKTCRCSPTSPDGGGAPTAAAAGRVPTVARAGTATTPDCSPKSTRTPRGLRDCVPARLEHSHSAAVLLAKVRSRAQRLMRAPLRRAPRRGTRGRTGASSGGRPKPRDCARRLYVRSARKSISRKNVSSSPPVKRAPVPQSAAAAR